MSRVSLNAEKNAALQNVKNCFSIKSQLQSVGKPKGRPLGLKSLFSNKNAKGGFLAKLKFFKKSHTLPEIHLLYCFSIRVNILKNKGENTLNHFGISMN